MGCWQNQSLFCTSSKKVWKLMLMPCVIFTDSNDMWQRSGNNVSLALWVCVSEHPCNILHVAAACYILNACFLSLEDPQSCSNISSLSFNSLLSLAYECYLITMQQNDHFYTQFKTHYEIKSKSKYWFVRLKWKFKSHLKLGERSLRNLDGFFVVFMELMMKKSLKS